MSRVARCRRKSRSKRQSPWVWNHGKRVPGIMQGGVVIAVGGCVHEPGRPRRGSKTACSVQNADPDNGQGVFENNQSIGVRV